MEYVETMSSTSDDNLKNEGVMKMAVDIVAAFVSNNSLPSAQITEVIRSVYDALNSLAGNATGAVEELPKPAVPIKKSVTPDYLICLEDGKKLKMLKRHLRTTYNMSLEEYKTRWGLPVDYPTVAPNYARQRSDFAKKIGLGRKDKTA